MRHLSFPARVVGLLPFGLLAACHSQPKAPDLGHGPGLVSFDREPPAGAETFARPEWKAGDRFVFRKAHSRRLPYRVEKDEAGGWRLVDEESKSVLRVDGDLRELGEVRADKENGAVVLDPGDSRYSWPLWVGKRWACEFVLRGNGQPAFPLLASYQCDGIETVKTPAGSFRCLRIWRAARVAAKGDFVERVALFWYSPEAGTLVKSLDDGILTELEEVQRQ